MQWKQSNQIYKQICKQIYMAYTWQICKQIYMTQCVTDLQGNLQGNQPEIHSIEA